MSSRIARITFNEVVRCARIVCMEQTSVECVQEIAPISLKAKPIMFKPRGQILASHANISIFSMECTVESKMPPAQIANVWHIDVHMRLYFEEDTQYPNRPHTVKRTSPIISFEGNIVTTFSGSVYILGEIDPLIKKRIADVDISEADPLNEDTLPYLINAAMDLYYPYVSF
jgi:hypothetical protein